VAWSVGAALAATVHGQREMGQPLRGKVLQGEGMVGAAEPRGPNAGAGGGRGRLRTELHTVG
jgi:hypothetical protein